MNMAIKSNTLILYKVRFGWYFYLLRQSTQIIFCPQIRRGKNATVIDYDYVTSNDQADQECKSIARLSKITAFPSTYCHNSVNT